MYKVFVNERPIILTNTLTKESGFKLFLLDEVPLEEVIKQLNSGSIDEAHLYFPDKTQLLQRFMKKLPVVRAAGGVVRNDAGDLLFIYRNGKWDLPKGKIEKGETIEETAVREVEEETGVSGIHLKDFIMHTYHIFKRNGMYKLKVTHWYEMETSYNGTLTAQLEEGIEDVVWKNDTASRKALENSYPNIRILLGEGTLSLT